MSFNPEYAQSDLACEGPLRGVRVQNRVVRIARRPLHLSRQSPVAPAPESAAAQIATASNLLLMMYLRLPQWTPC